VCGGHALALNLVAAFKRDNDAVSWTSVESVFQQVVLNTEDGLAA
jgi:hypothetical protein